MAAEGAAGVQLLRTLREGGHELVGVFTTTAPDHFRGVTVAQAAHALGCPVWPGARLKDEGFVRDLTASGVDLLLNVHSLHVLPEGVLAAPRFGAFNLHPGPLPEYAGLNVVSWALYRGEARHGVTVHRMVREIDRGPVAYQERFPVSDSDTAMTVGARCVSIGIGLVKRLAETAAAAPQAIPAIEQDGGARRYFGRGVPQGGRVDWASPARDIVNFVRACDYGPFPSPWGKPEASLGPRVVALHRVSLTGERAASPPGSLGRGAGNKVLVATGDEWVRVDRAVGAPNVGLAPSPTAKTEGQWVPVMPRS